MVRRLDKFPSAATVTLRVTEDDTAKNLYAKSYTNALYIFTLSPVRFPPAKIIYVAD